MSRLPAERFLLQAVAVVDGLALPYMIIGGFAVRTWGIPRPTYDGDIAVAVSDEELPKLLAALERDGFDVPDEHRAGFLDKLAGMGKLKVTRLEGTTVWRVDFFLIRGPFLESALQRRKPLSLAGRDVFVVAPEDLILLKLIANRRKDQSDVEEILRVSANLDVAYLKRWARELKVEARLRDFLTEP